MASLLQLIFITFAVFSNVLGQMTEAPSPLTARIGDTVTLTCQVSGEVYTEWLEYITTPVGRKIYNSISGVIGDPNKYEVEGTHNLIIKDLQFSDGGLYGCNVDGLIEPARADLVVMETPEAYSGELIEGETKTVSCTTRFMGPSLEVIDEQHIPMAEGYIFDDKKFTNYEIAKVDEYYAIRIDVNYTGIIGDNGKNFTCRTYTPTPFYEDYGMTLINVLFEVREMELAPRNERYYPGEQINCTAKGNPEPDFQWIPEYSAGARPISSQILPIEINMLGENSWKCQATNNVKEITDIEEIINFIVVEEDGGGGEEEIETPTTQAWAIALGVLIPIAVIVILIVAIAVFWKKRMSPSKNSPQTATAKSRTKTTPPKPLEHANPNYQEESYYEDDMPDYYPGYTTIATVQQAGRQNFPANPQQLPFASYQAQHPYTYNNGRQSPAYADLGIKPFPGPQYPQPMTYDVSNVSSSGNSMGFQPQFNPYAVHPGIINAGYKSESNKRLNQSKESLTNPGETTI